MSSKTTINPERIRLFDEKINPEELPPDYFALISLVFGFIGLLMRYKIAAWASLFSGIVGIATMRKDDMDIKQMLTSMLFASMSLIINYFGIKTSTTGGFLA